MLGAVVVLMLVLLASPLHRYFGSRGDVSSAAQQLRKDTATLHRLQHQQKQWGDPGYVEQQARARLQYAMPGDTVYVVVDHGAKSDLQKTVRTVSATHDDGTWNTKLWGSVTRAATTP